MMVFNKVDAAPLGVGTALARMNRGVAVSAHDPASLSPLLERLRTAAAAHRAPTGEHARAAAETT